MRRKKKTPTTHAHLRLRDRETTLSLRTRFGGGGGPTTPMYAEIPPRLRAPIERILDRERRLLRAVVLGFTADGGHVVAHHHDRANGGEHWVQFWTFDVHGKRPSKIESRLVLPSRRDLARLELRVLRAVLVHERPELHLGKHGERVQKTLFEAI